MKDLIRDTGLCSYYVASFTSNVGGNIIDGRKCLCLRENGKHETALW